MTCILFRYFWSRLVSLKGRNITFQIINYEIKNFFDDKLKIFVSRKISGINE